MTRSFNQAEKRRIKNVLELEHEIRKNSFPSFKVTGTEDRTDAIPRVPMQGGLKLEECDPSHQYSACKPGTRRKTGLEPFPRAIRRLLQLLIEIGIEERNIVLYKLNDVLIVIEQRSRVFELFLALVRVGA